MLCPKCGKESSNLRICGYCQTPYPTDAPDRGGSKRGTRAGKPSRSSNAPAGGALGALGDFIGRQSRATLWSVIGVLALLTVAYQFTGRDPAIPVGVVLPNFITAPMSPVEATNTLRALNGSTQPGERAGEVTVRVPKASFPERRQGQLALAQQYARADEIIQGRKRTISFLDPDGKLFAKADPEKGVSMTR